MDRGDRFRSAFLEAVGESLGEGTKLSELSNFRIGGRADFVFEARTNDGLKKAIALARREKFPFYVIGGGFNILFDDDGYRGLIVRNLAEEVEYRNGRLIASSGTGLPSLLKSARGQSLTGLEFLAGIPGTLGGALFSNAGAFGQSIGEAVEEAVLLGTEGREQRISGRDFGFAYRRSLLQEKHSVILEASLVVAPGDGRSSDVKVRDFLERRRTKHPPWGTACAGSYFKNPCSADGQRVAAGRLLEQAGAKGLSVGGAVVYEEHGNFILNAGDATARDVLLLAQELKERVLKMFGVALEEEVVYLPATASMS